MKGPNYRRIVPLILSIGLLFILFSCGKEKVEEMLPPRVNFRMDLSGDIGGTPDTSHSFTIATYNAFQLKNLSDNVASVHWDFGNGSSSDEWEPSSFYTKAGSYTITLTVTGKDGSTSSLSREAKVVERVLKKIRITALNWNSGFSDPLNWPAEKKAGVYVQIKELSHGAYQEFENGAYNGNNFYQTAIREAVSGQQSPIEFDVPGKHVIAIPLLNDHRYGINLHARDATTDYILSSSWGSAVGFGYYRDRQSGEFVIHTGFNGNKIELICAYE